MCEKGGCFSVGGVVCVEMGVVCVEKGCVLKGQICVKKECLFVVMLLATTHLTPTSHISPPVV